jgi:hypothetical protein
VGTQEEKLGIFRRVRDQIIEHIDRELLQGGAWQRRA